MAGSSLNDDHHTVDGLEDEPKDKIEDKPNNKSADKLDDKPNDNKNGDDEMAQFAPVRASLNLEYLPHFASALRRSNQQATGAEATSDSDSNLTLPDCTVVSPPLCGAYHIVFPLKFTDGTQWVLKVPSSGHLGKWSDISARSLKCEALTMRLLKRKTSIPIPEVYLFDASLDNQLGCPFILMEYIQGIQLHKVWFNKTATPEFVEQCRQRALEDIADAMVQLKEFSYNQGGSLSFDEEGNVAGISPMQVKDFPDPFIYRGDPDAGDHCEAGPFNDAKTQLLYFLNSRQPLGSRTCDGKLMDDDNLGTYKVLRMFLDWIPAELLDNNLGFVLTHLDFAVQNILLTEEGRLCGLIDWDGVTVQPRCIGCESYPNWLTRDWNPPLMYRYKPEGPNPMESSPEELARYRSMYRHFMRRALAKKEASHELRALEILPSTSLEHDRSISLTHYSLPIANLATAADCSGLTLQFVENMVDKIERDTAAKWANAASDADPMELGESEAQWPDAASDADSLELEESEAQWPDTAFYKILMEPEGTAMETIQGHPMDRIVPGSLYGACDEEEDSHDISWISSTTLQERDDASIASTSTLQEEESDTKLKKDFGQTRKEHRTSGVEKVVPLENVKVEDDEQSLAVSVFPKSSTTVCLTPQITKGTAKEPNQEATFNVSSPEVPYQDEMFVELPDTDPLGLSEDRVQDSVTGDAAHQNNYEKDSVSLGPRNGDTEEEKFPFGCNRWTGFNYFEITETLAHGDLDEKRVRRLKEGFLALMENPDSLYESCLIEKNGIAWSG